MAKHSLATWLARRVKKSVGLVLEDELIYVCEEGLWWVEIPQKKLWWLHDRHHFPHNYQRVLRNPLGFMVLCPNIMRRHIPIPLLNKRVSNVTPRRERRAGH